MSDLPGLPCGLPGLLWSSLDLNYLPGPESGALIINNNHCNQQEIIQIYHWVNLVLNKLQTCHYSLLLYEILLNYVDGGISLQYFILSPHYIPHQSHHNNVKKAMNAASINEALAYYEVSCDATEEQVEYLMSILLNPNECDEEKTSWLVSLIPELDEVDMSVELESIVELLRTQSTFCDGIKKSPESVSLPLPLHEEPISPVDISFVTGLLPGVEMDQIDYLLTVLLNKRVSDDEKACWVASMLPELEDIDVKAELPGITRLLTKYQDQASGGVRTNVSSIFDCTLVNTARTAAPATPTATEGVNQPEDTGADSSADTIKLEDITFLCDLFPQITPDLMMFVYEVKYSSHRNATADYLFDLVCSQADTDAEGEGEGEQAEDSETLEVRRAISGESAPLSEEERNAELVAGLVAMRTEYESRVKTAERHKYLAERRVQDMILKRYSERVVVPKYDDRGNEVRPKFDPRKFTGYASLKAAKKQGGKAATEKLSTRFDTSLAKVRFINNQVVTHSGEREVTVKDSNEPNLGPLRTKENKGSLAKAAKAKSAKKKK